VKLLAGTLAAKAAAGRCLCSQQPSAGNQGQQLTLLSKHSVSEIFFTSPQGFLANFSKRLIIFK